MFQAESKMSIKFAYFIQMCQNTDSHLIFNIEMFHADKKRGFP